MVADERGVWFMEFMPCLVCCGWAACRLGLDRGNQKVVSFRLVPCPMACLDRWFYESHWCSRWSLMDGWMFRFELFGASRVLETDSDLCLQLPRQSDGLAAGWTVETDGIDFVTVISVLPVW